MQLENTSVQVENDFFSPQLLQRTTTFDDGAVLTNLQDTSLTDFHLIRGYQSAIVDSPVFVDFDTSSYVTHFALRNAATNNKQTLSKDQNTYSTYYQDRALPESGFIGAHQEYVFFELAFRESFLQKIIEEDTPYSERLFKQYNKLEYMNATRHPILPSMLQCIHELNSNSFTGVLQQLYLETKSAELFLLQVQALYTQNQSISSLKQRDIECLHDARLYIEQNYQTPCSIIDLARIVGINQTKLKSGFKKLFGTTVFGYVRDLQMEKAKQLLLDEKLYVNEVADQIGYKHPQHFTVAFKRKFGILPSELK